MENGWFIQLMYSLYKQGISTFLCAETLVTAYLSLHVQKVEIGNSSALLGFLAWSCAESGPDRLTGLDKDVRGKHRFSRMALGFLELHLVLKGLSADTQAITGRRAFLEFTAFLQTPRPIALPCPLPKRRDVCIFSSLISSSVL